MARRTRSQRSGSGGFWLFLFGLLVGAGALWLYLADDRPGSLPALGKAPVDSRPDRGDREGREGSTIEEAGSVEPPLPSVPPEAPEEELPAGTQVSVEGGGSRPGHVALVIDDLGRSLEDVRRLEELGVPISYAVLPYEEQTPAVVSELRREGREILLHLPMEAKNGEDPGPGALRLGMSPEELRDGTAAALQAVPGAVGVNNHMGSGMSADEPSMSAILQVLAGRGLFFLDSRTSADSVAYRTALSLGVPSAERQVFLDRDPNPAAIQEQFQRLLGLARARGAAVAIGHPHPETLAVLETEVPKAKAQGYEFVPVSFLLDREGEPE